MWMNAASPVLFMGPWKKGEDKKLMTLAKHHDYRNWETIARELGVSIKRCSNSFSSSTAYPHIPYVLDLIHTYK